MGIVLERVLVKKIEATILDFEVKDRLVVTNEFETGLGKRRLEEDVVYSKLLRGSLGDEIELSKSPGVFALVPFLATELVIFVLGMLQAL